MSDMCIGYVFVTNNYYVSCNSNNREMFEAKRWLENPMYFSPMATIEGRHVFVGDIMTLRQTDNFVKILKFITEVKIVNILYILYNTL